jgi:hypothetical protein
MHDGRQAQPVDGRAYFTGTRWLDPTGPARCAHFPRQRVRRTARVHDNGALVALPQDEPGFGKRVPECDGLGWRPGGGKHRAQVGGVDFGALLDVAAVGRQRCDLDGPVQIVVPRHPLGSGSVAVADQSSIDRTRLRNRRGRQAELGGSEDGDLFSPAVGILEVHDPPAGPHEGIDNMCVDSAVLGVQDAAPLLIPDVELGFEVTEKDPDGLGVVVTDVRVNVNVPHGPGGATVGSAGDELAQLPWQVVGGQMAGSDKLNPLIHSLGKQMPCQCGATPSSGFARKHPGPVIAS